MRGVEGKIMFNPAELDQVEMAVLRAEELIFNFFKLSSSQWLKNRYDIKTARNMAPHERVIGPYAQVLKYEGRKADAPLGSSAFSLYHVCLQDPAILTLVSRKSAIHLAPFLLYILVHELVHVVRFLRFEYRYETGSEADLSMDEERKVHGLTRKIVAPVRMAGLSEVLDFYGQW